MNDKAKNQYEIDQDNEKIMDELINQISRHSKEMSDIIKLMEKVRAYRAEIYKIQLELKHYLVDIYSKKTNQNLEEIKQQLERDGKVRTNESITNWIENTPGVNDICNIAQSENIYPATVVIEKMRELLNEEYDMYEIQNEENKKWIYIFKEETVFKSEKFTEDFGNNVFNILSKLYSNKYNEITIKITDEALEKLENGQLSIGKNEYATERAKKMKNIENDCIKSINTTKIAQILQYYEQELIYWQREKLKNQLEIGDTEEYIE